MRPVGEIVASVVAKVERLREQRAAARREVIETNIAAIRSGTDEDYIRAADAFSRYGHWQRAEIE